MQEALDPAGEPLGVDSGVVTILDEDRELVAAEPGDRVAGPDRPAEPFRDPDHQFVADRMPEGVVDRLEVVEVDEHDRDPGAGATYGACT